MRVGYTIYKALVGAWLLRERRKQLEGAPSADDLWRACMALALRLHRSEEQTITPDALEQLIQETPPLRHLRAMDVGGRSLLNKTSSGAYRFAHRTVQEFLVVYAVLEGGGPRPGRLRGTDAIVSFLSAALFDPGLRAADLGCLDLCGLDLSHLVLSRAKMRGCNLRGANLELAFTYEEEGELKTGWPWSKGATSEDVERGNIVQRFDGALSDHTTRWPRGETPHGAIEIVGGADLEGLDLREADLSNADLRGANLAGAMLTDARVQGMWVDLETYNRSRWTPSLLASLRGRGAVIEGPERFSDDVRLEVLGEPVVMTVWLLRTHVLTRENLVQKVASVDGKLLQVYLGLHVRYFSAQVWGQEGRDQLLRAVGQPGAPTGSGVWAWADATDTTLWAMTSLSMLLQALFTPPRLLRWVGTLLPTEVSGLPGSDQPVAYIASEVADMYQRHGLRAVEIVDSLLAEHPTHEADIRAALQFWPYP